jgi:hypothetical protein
MGAEFNSMSTVRSGAGADSSFQARLAPGSRSHRVDSLVGELVDALVSRHP